MKKLIFYRRQYSFLEFLKFLMVVLVARIQSFFAKYIYESWKTFDTLFDSKLIAKKVGQNNLIEWKINGITLKIFLRRFSSDFAVFNQVFIAEEYKPLILLASLNNVKVHTVVDLGANIGLTSIFLSTKYPNSKVYALEPHLGNYEMLRENISINALENIKTLRLALWHEAGDVTLANDFADQREWANRISDTSSGTSVPANTLDFICKREKIEKIDVLKIDIEGAEVAILKKDSTIRRLLKDQVKIIAIELHGSLEERHFVISILLESFKCYFFGESVFGVNENLCNNP